MNETNHHIFSDVAGGPDFIQHITTKHTLGLHIPSNHVHEAKPKQIQVAYDEDNPRLAITPLIEHEKTGYLIVAAFHAPDMDEAPHPNFRASILMSLFSGQPMVVFNDMSIFQSECFHVNEITAEPERLGSAMDMSREISEDLTRQFESPESLLRGWLPMVALDMGHDPCNLLHSLVTSFDWKSHKYEL